MAGGSPRFSRAWSAFTGGAATDAASQRLIGIQILRALAALMVVYSHLMARNVNRGFLTGNEWWNVDLGHFGVCIFFAISGYVMIHASARTFAAARKGPSVALFLKRRIARICPLYYLTTVAAIAMAAAVHGEAASMGDIVRSLLFIPYLNESGLYQPVYSLGWSLNYEMFFYLVMATALFLPRTPAILFVIAVIGALLACGMALGSDPGAYGGSAAAYVFTRPEMFYFVAGVCAAALPLRSVERRIGALPWLALGGAAAGLALACAFQHVEWASALFSLVVVRAAAYHIAFARLWPHAARLLSFLGDASYSLYLTHSFVLGPVSILVAKTTSEPVLGVVASLVIGLAVAIVTASIVYLFIEKPLVNGATRLLQGRQRETAGTDAELQGKPA